MKLIEKIILVIYSIIIAILSILFCLLIFRWVNINIINKFIFQILNNSIYSTITLILCVIFILMSIKCVFFLSKKSDYYKDNIILENEEGKLVITKITVENLITNVLKGFSGAQNTIVKAKFDKQNNVIVNITILAKENVEMQELSKNMQLKVKEVIKKASGLDAKEVNVKIKNIESKKNIINDIQN